MGTLAEGGRQEVSYEYDPNGNLTKEIKPDLTEIVYTYNNLNQLTRAQYDINYYTDYEYDANGNWNSSTFVEPSC